jgi:dTDP-4-dehydrorhamnose 3,5-epimerase
MPVKVTPTEIPDVLLITTPIHRDERGFFTELFSGRDWRPAEAGATFVQDNLSCSNRGTLRGMHYQIEPHGVGKFVRVLRGAAYDVAVDLRRGSPTFGKWAGRTLTGEEGTAMWVPRGFAHGFITLEDETYVYYKCTALWNRQAERTLAYNDPTVNIQWPITPTLIAPRDATAPTLDKAEYNFVYGG